MLFNVGGVLISLAFNVDILVSSVVRSRGDQSGYFILGIHLEGMRLVGRIQAAKEFVINIFCTG